MQHDKDSVSLHVLAVFGIFSASIVLFTFYCLYRGVSAWVVFQENPFLGTIATVASGGYVFYSKFSRAFWFAFATVMRYSRHPVVRAMIAVVILCILVNFFQLSVTHLKIK